MKVFNATYSWTGPSSASDFIDVIVIAENKEDALSQAIMRTNKPYPENWEIVEFDTTTESVEIINEISN